MSAPAWIDALFREKSLWETRLVSNRFPTKPFDKMARCLVWILSLPIIGIVFTLFMSPSEEALSINAFGSTLAAYSATVIGFLVTGLAIFTTLADKSIWIELAKTYQKNAQDSSFKYLFYNILRVFTTYLTVFTISLIIYVFSSPVVEVKKFFALGYSWETASIINVLGFYALTVTFSEAILGLKSFIWNLYSTFLTMLTVSYILDESSEQN